MTYHRATIGVNSMHRRTSLWVSSLRDIKLGVPRIKVSDLCEVEDLWELGVSKYSIACNSSTA
jgi:hypothetical protein